MSQVLDEELLLPVVRFGEFDYGQDVRRFCKYPVHRYGQDSAFVIVQLALEMPAALRQTGEDCDPTQHDSCDFKELPVVFVVEDNSFIVESRQVKLNRDHGIPFVRVQSRQIRVKLIDLLNEMYSMTGLKSKIVCCFQIGLLSCIFEISD